MSNDQPEVACEYGAMGRHTWQRTADNTDICINCKRYRSVVPPTSAPKVEPVAGRTERNDTFARSLEFRLPELDAVRADLAAMTVERDKAVRMFKAAIAGQDSQDRWLPCIEHRFKVDYRVSGCPQCQIEKAIARAEVDAKVEPVACNCPVSIGTYGNHSEWCATIRAHPPCDAAPKVEPVADSPDSAGDEVAAALRYLGYIATGFGQDGLYENRIQTLKAAALLERLAADLAATKENAK